MEKSNLRFVILSAPSGSGKTTLANVLIRKYPQFAFSISATTRTPRSYEVHGQHYYFLSVEEFRSRVEKGEFLEHEEVYEGRFYGTLWSEIERISAEGKVPILDVDVVGGLNIKDQYKENALSIFVQAPSLEVLKERLISRDSDSAEEIEKRINKARKEMSYKSRFDITIVNENLEEASDQLFEAVNHFLSKDQIS